MLGILPYPIYRILMKRSVSFSAEKSWVFGGLNMGCHVFKERNKKFVKITTELDEVSYLKMQDFCRKHYSSYKAVLNNALREYLEKYK